MVLAVSIPYLSIDNNYEGYSKKSFVHLLMDGVLNQALHVMSTEEDTQMCLPFDGDFSAMEWSDKSLTRQLINSECHNMVAQELFEQKKKKHINCVDP